MKKQLLFVLAILILSSSAQAGVASFVGGFIVGRITSPRSNTTEVTVINEGPSADTIAAGVYMGMNLANIQAERRALARRLEMNEERYSQIREALNRRVSETLPSIDDGTYVCTSFCGSFDDNGNLSIIPVVSHSSTKAGAWKNLTAGCKDPRFALFREMKTGLNSQGEPLQMLMQSELVDVCDIKGADKPVSRSSTKSKVGLARAQ
jgi:hypothetical protein